MEENLQVKRDEIAQPIAVHGIYLDPNEKKKKNTQKKYL